MSTELFPPMRIEGMPVTDALRTVMLERRLQDAKWGIQDHGQLVWAAILGEEFGEYQQAILEALCFDNGRRREFDAAKVRRELVQVCAVALAAIECIDRKGAQP